MNKPLEIFNDMVKCNQLDYGDSKEVDLIRKTLTEAYEHEELTRKLLGEKYMMRVMLWQLLGQADLTLEESPTGTEAIHVKLDACEFFWTGWGIHWIKENLSYKIKTLKEEKKNG